MDLTEKTFWYISSVLVDLQGCTVPYFKDESMINNSFYCYEAPRANIWYLYLKISVQIIITHPSLALSDYGASPACRQECKSVPSYQKQECKTVPRQQCNDIATIKCQNVPREKCEDVPKHIPKQECQNIPRKVCNNVSQQIPKQKCENVQKQKCNHASYKDQVCNTVNEQVCETINEQVCNTVPARQCTMLKENVCKTVYKEICEQVCDNQSSYNQGYVK